MSTTYEISPALRAALERALKTYKMAYDLDSPLPVLQFWGLDLGICHYLEVLTDSWDLSDEFEGLLLDLNSFYGYLVDSPRDYHNKVKASCTTSLRDACLKPRIQVIEMILAGDPNPLRYCV